MEMLLLVGMSLWLSAISFASLPVLHIAIKMCAKVFFYHTERKRGEIGQTERKRRQGDRSIQTETKSKGVWVYRQYITLIIIGNLSGWEIGGEEKIASRTGQRRTETVGNNNKQWDSGIKFGDLILLVYKSIDVTTHNLLEKGWNTLRRALDFWIILKFTTYTNHTTLQLLSICHWLLFCFIKVNGL